MIRFTRILILVFSFSILIVFTACSKNPESARNELQKMNIEYSENAFAQCAEQGNTNAVKLFLDAGMNPNAVDTTYHWTALMLAARNGHNNTVKVLLDKGADVNTTAQRGVTAL